MSAEAGDCNDDDEDSYPGAEEICDGEDQDCDDSVDEDATDGATWYIDADDDTSDTASTTAADPYYQQG